MLNERYQENFTAAQRLFHQNELTSAYVRASKSLAMAAIMSDEDLRSQSRTLCRGIEAEISKQPQSSKHWKDIAVMLAEELVIIQNTFDNYRVATSPASIDYQPTGFWML